MNGQPRSRRPQLDGYLGTRDLPDGRRLFVLPLVYEAARLGIGAPDVGWMDDVWDYTDRAVALEELARWDGQGEPRRWNRHPGSGRRRPDGTLASERVQL